MERVRIEIAGFSVELALLAWRHGGWCALPLARTDGGYAAVHKGIKAELVLRGSNPIDYTLRFSSEYPTRLRLRLSLPGQTDFFHLIPGNIFGDNNAAHARPGEFPVLADDRLHERNRSPIWEFRADRASHPVSILCCSRGAVGISIDPYSPDASAEDGFIRNGVFAELPNHFGVSLGYGNDPLTFVEKTHFRPATADLARSAQASGTIYAQPGGGRRKAHAIVRAVYEKYHDRAKFAGHLQGCADSAGRLVCKSELVAGASAIHESKMRSADRSDAASVARHRRNRLDWRQHTGLSLCPGRANLSRSALAQTRRANLRRDLRRPE